MAGAIKMPDKEKKLKKKSPQKVKPLFSLMPEYAELSHSERKLIRLIHSIGFGEIEAIEIKNGRPVSYKMAWKSGKFNSGGR